MITNADDRSEQARFAASLADLERESRTCLQRSRLRVARHQERAATRWAVAVLSEAAEELRRPDELDDELATKAVQDARERRLLEDEIENVFGRGDRRSAPLTLAQLVALIDGIMARGITTVKGITRELNAQGIPARRGYGRWWPATVRALLREAREAGLMCAHTTSVT